jgi:PAS domain S-box-containing protein
MPELGRYQSLAQLPTLILEQMADAVIAVDRNGCIVYWNREAERLFHLTAHQASRTLPEEISSGLLGVTPEVDHATSPAGMRPRVRRQETVRTQGTGEDIHLESSVTPLVDADGAPLGLLAVFRDITATKHREIDQERRLVELHAIVDHFRALSGLIPICSHCKRIRDENGGWHEIEIYIGHQLGAKFSHGICPNCVQGVPSDETSAQATPQ